MTMKWKLLFLLFAVMALNANGQEFDQELIAINKVHSIHEFLYRPHEQKKLIRAHLFNEQAKLIEKYESSYTTPTIKYSYDTLGHLIAEVHYNLDKSINESYKYSYDKLNRISEKFTYFSWAKQVYKDNYVYDTNNHLIEIYQLNEKEQKVKSTTYSYYSNGTIKEERFRNPEIELERIKKFDKCGNLYEQIENGVNEVYDNLYSNSCKLVEPKGSKRISIDTLSDLTIRKTALFDKRKTIEIISPSGVLQSYEEYNYSATSIYTLSSSHQRFYNDKGQVIEVKDFYSGKGKLECGLSSGAVADSYFDIKYYYLPNGLKESYQAFDTKGKLLETVKYEVDYFK